MIDRGMMILEMVTANMEVNRLLCIRVVGLNLESRLI